MHQSAVRVTPLRDGRDEQARLPQGSSSLSFRNVCSPIIGLRPQISVVRKRLPQIDAESLAPVDQVSRKLRLNSFMSPSPAWVDALLHKRCDRLRKAGVVAAVRAAIAAAMVKLALGRLKAFHRLGEIPDRIAIHARQSINPRHVVVFAAHAALDRALWASSAPKGCQPPHPARVGNLGNLGNLCRAARRITSPERRLP